MSEIIKYHNDMNKVSFADFKEKELDLFFSICQKMKDKGNTEVQFDFSEIREISQYSNRSIQRLYSDLDRIYKKMLELNLKYEDENIIKRFVLFNKYVIDKNEKVIRIKASEDFEYILNNLIGNFTKFDLKDLISLKSLYSKTLFRLLKQWESIKIKEFTIDEFRSLLAIPEKYRISEIDKKVLKPIMEELPKHFYNLKLEKIKTGRRVTSLKFTWENRAIKKEIIDLDENEVIEIKISEELNKAIEKAKKNRYIENLLTIDNIELLLSVFEENNLVKGLIWAYKEITHDITSLNYLVKTIRTGATKKEKKLVVVQEEQKKNIFEETFKEIPLNFEEQKEKITKKEYETLYKNYLKENGINHLKSVRISFDNANKEKYEIIEKKIYTEKDIDEKLLVSKNGKKLVGSARKYKIEKILKELNSI